MTLVTVLTAPAAAASDWSFLGDLWPVIAGAVLSGAVLAGVVALFGAWIESRREHRRWLRERRYEAYTRVYALIQAFNLNAGKTERIARRLVPPSVENGPKWRLKVGLWQVRTNRSIRALLAEDDSRYGTVGEVLAPILLLGPREVTVHALAMQNAHEAGDREAYGKASRAFLRAAAKVLKVEKPWTRLIEGRRHRMPGD